MENLVEILKSPDTWFERLSYRDGYGLYRIIFPIGSNRMDIEFIDIPERLNDFLKANSVFWLSFHYDSVNCVFSMFFENFDYVKYGCINKSDIDSCLNSFDVLYKNII